MATHVACCQIAPDVLDPERSAELAAGASAAAVAAGAQVVVLPELATSGYVFTSVEEAEAAALSAEEVADSWAPVAARGDAIVVGGFCERAPDGRLYNSCALVDRDGLRAVYRKLHLWGEEPRWFAAGDQPAPVVDTRHGRIGLGICYDIEFPELTRGLALAGAELIALPTNWPHDPVAPDGQPILHALAATTAYLSRVYVAVCDRCGRERGLEFEGGSVIAGPDGGLRAGLVRDRGVETLLAECDLTEARRKRSGEHNDVFADRRPAYYASALAVD
jgi:predicted amidohydrolase